MFTSLCSQTISSSFLTVSSHITRISLAHSCCSFHSSLLRSHSPLPSPCSNSSPNQRHVFFLQHCDNFLLRLPSVSHLVSQFAFASFLAVVLLFYCCCSCCCCCFLTCGSLVLSCFLYVRPPFPASPLPRRTCYALLLC